MRDSGCVAAFLGIEALDQRLLDTHNKGVSTHDIEDAVNACLAERLSLIGFFMIGLPGETVQSLRRSLDFARRHPFPPRAKFATPYPGTRLADVYRIQNPCVSDEELLLRIAEVTNGPEDYTTFGLSDVPHSALLNVMAEFRGIERERITNQGQADTAMHEGHGLLPRLRPAPHSPPGKAEQ